MFILKLGISAFNNDPLERVINKLLVEKSGEDSDDPSYASQAAKQEDSFSAVPKITDMKSLLRFLETLKIRFEMVREQIKDREKQIERDRLRQLDVISSAIESISALKNLLETASPALRSAIEGLISTLIGAAEKEAIAKAKKSTSASKYLSALVSGLKALGVDISLTNSDMENVAKLVYSEEQKRLEKKELETELGKVEKEIEAPGITVTKAEQLNDKKTGYESKINLQA